MNKIAGHKQNARGLSSLFTRRVFDALLHKDSVSLVSQILDYYNIDLFKGLTLSQIFKKSYFALAKDYRCEYLYKNELLNQKLIKNYGTHRTLAINEFKVGNSIVDIAMFNGESKAFEIKSDLDSPFRLAGQMVDYTRLFQKCYVVVPETMLDNYINAIGCGIGVIVLTKVKRHLELETYRSAQPNEYIDPYLVMRCLHTKEYMHLINSYFGYLPQKSMFDMFQACSEMMGAIPSDILQVLFLKEIESRQNATHRLLAVQKELRQMCLSMNMNLTDISVLNNHLTKNIY